METFVADSGVGGSYGEYLASLPRIAEKSFSVSAHTFVSRCLTFDVISRPSADRLLDHPFIKQTRKIDLTLAQLLHPVTPIDETTDLGRCSSLCSRRPFRRATGGKSVFFLLCYVKRRCRLLIVSFSCFIQLTQSPTCNLGRVQILKGAQIMYYLALVRSLPTSVRFSGVCCLP